MSNSRFSRMITAALAMGFMVNVLGATLPASAAPATPAAKTTTARATTAPKAKTVEGTITKWDDKTSTFQTKATVQTWSFSFDKTKLQKVGAVGLNKRVKITYHMNGKVYVADKVEVIAKK